MKSKVMGFAAVALLLAFGAASSAFADGIPCGSDHDFDRSSPTFAMPSPAVHADNALTDQDGDHDARSPEYDHILASSGRWLRDHDKDRDGASNSDSSSSDPSGSDPMPEPSSLLLLATGLTPLLWVRRRGDGV